MGDDFYLKQQQLLAGRKWYRRFWVGFGVYGVLFYYAAAVYLLLWPGGWKMLLPTGAAAFLARYVICEIIVLFYKKPHPYQRLNFKVPVNWLLFSSMDQRHDSMPSQHAVTAAAISAVLWSFFPPVGIVAFIILALMERHG